METKYTARAHGRGHDFDEPKRSNISRQEFGLDKIPPYTFLDRLRSSLTQAILRHMLLPVLRRIPSIVKIGGIHWVTRYDDVVAVLADPQAFNVPFGPEMKTLAGGTNFALGDNDNDPDDSGLHARQRKLMQDVWDFTDGDARIREPARFAATALLRDAGGEIDAVKDLFTRVATEVCLKIYGLSTDNADDFAEYAMSTTALLFADPFGDKEVRIQALYGAERLREILDANYDRVWALPDDQISDSPELLKRLIWIVKKQPNRVGRQGADDQQRRAEIRSVLFGLVTGFVPTNTMAAGNILEELAARPDQFEEARSLARAVQSSPSGSDKSDKRAELTKLLFEAARFNPALFPGQFRVRSEAVLSQKTTGDLSHKFKRIKRGDTVMVATASALMDGAKFSDPSKFDLNRFGAPNSPRNLAFGVGPHDCLGEMLAKDIITETFQVLLEQPRVAFADKRLYRAGPFPRHMNMRFAPKAGHREQSMITAALPLKPDANAEELKNVLRSFGHPRREVFAADQTTKQRAEDIGHTLDSSEIVHFASLNVVDLGTLEQPKHFLLVELNLDGPKEQAIERFVKATESSDKPGLLSGLREYLDVDNGASIQDLLDQYSIDFHCKPWGSIGLNFAGTGDFPVAQIAEEQKLYECVAKIVDDIRTAPESAAARQKIQSESARYVLEETRRLLREKHPEFAALLLRPSARVPAFSKWADFSFNEFIRRYFSKPSFLTLYFSFLAATIAVPIALWLIAGTSIWGAYVTFTLTPLLLLATALIFFLATLRNRERADKPEDRNPDHTSMRRLLEREDLPGYGQNHLTSVTPLKPGFFRKITLAASLFTIKQMAILWFRPGFVTDFATIHYAKWFRIKGTEKLIFQTNYDGSWESYLEDFVTKVHGGQTAAWNNGIGFPQTNWFYFDGARDGDRFKRWVRRQQIETLFWYSRFPNLTTEQIRTNALVRDGLARARTSSEAEAWENLFHSAPRPRDTLQSEQVQSLVFGGLGRHREARAHFVRFNDPARAREWIGWCAENSYNAETIHKHEAQAAILAFGDYAPAGDAMFIAFTASGLRALGLNDGNGSEGLSTFPVSFVDGMASRKNILGDYGHNDPSHWQWSDAACEKGCHAVILYYGGIADPQNASKSALPDRSFREACEKGDMEVSATVQMSFGRGRLDHREPFGFLDSVSQPVMRGTRQFSRGGFAADDVVEPGEFLLGYKDTRGYYPPSPTVRQATDRNGDLAPLQVAISDLVPEFNHRALSELRDLGRNGSFLVIRQFEQDVPAFTGFVKEQAKALVDAKYLSKTQQQRNAVRPDPSLFGGQLDQQNQVLPLSINTGRFNIGRGPASPAYSYRVAEELLAAKIMGRWKDGSSLVRHPTMSRTQLNKYEFFHELRRRIRLSVDDQDAQEILARIPAGEALDEIIWDENVSEKRIREFIVEFRKKHIAVDLPLQTLTRIEPDNDFRHGTDDPQGLACPIASHVRRANPRDSFRPGSALQMEINNRHRILRRGRTYQTKQGDQLQNTGTFFMCFNANIERQFEFINQTWMNSRSFHGLRNSPDPLVSPKAEDDRFPIPTSEHTFSLPLDRPTDKDGKKFKGDFVKVVGGGYFFLPSLQGLRFIARSLG